MSLDNVKSLLKEDCEGLSQEQVIEKLVESEYGDSPAITNSGMQNAVKQTITNTLREMNEDATTTGSIAQYTPVVVSLIRRIMPTLVGPEMVGMQPLKLPTGRVFMQHVYTHDMKNSTKSEVWANGTVGTGTATGAAPNPAISGPYATSDGESLGYTGGDSWNEMSFAISSVDVGVKTRALKGKLTTEVIQDLKAVHNLNANDEITKILQTELTADIDREMVATIFKQAKLGAQNCQKPGTFDFSVDADGRWMMEKVMGLYIQLEQEATMIALETRRGRGNFILTSPELAAFLSMANLITNDYKGTGFSPVVNPVGVSYFGMLSNRFKVYVDPYLTSTRESIPNPEGGDPTAGRVIHQCIVGYKGINEYDAGIVYCPYVPISFHSATDTGGFGPIFGVKSRYGIVSNPYYMSNNSTLAADATNSYFRKFSVITQNSI